MPCIKFELSPSVNIVQQGMDTSRMLSEQYAFVGASIPIVFGLVGKVRVRPIHIARCNKHRKPPHNNPRAKSIQRNGQISGLFSGRLLALIPQHKSTGANIYRDLSTTTKSVTFASIIAIIIFCLAAATPIRALRATRLRALAILAPRPHFYAP